MQACSVLPVFIVLFSLEHITSATTCTWSAGQTDSAGDQSQAESVSSAAFSLDQCQTACENKAGCVAIDFVFSACNTYTTSQSLSTVVGKTYYELTCTADTTTAVTTTASTTASSTGTCQTTAVADNTVTASCENQVSVDLSASLQNCQNLCNALAECLAVSYGSSTCVIHASSTTQASQSGYQYSTRTQCADFSGNYCFNTDEDVRGSSSTSYSVQATLAFCQELCVAASDCVALTFGGSTCTLYKSVTTQSASGSNYYSKSCSQGASTGSLTLDSSTACGRASALTGGVPALLILSSVAFVLALA